MTNFTYMNISQSQLTQVELDLIRLVLNFHFDLGRSSICLNDINLQIDLAPIVSAEYYTETFDVNQLHDIRKEQESQLTIVKSEYDSVNQKLSELYDSLSDEEKSWESDEEPYAHAPVEFKKLHDEHVRLESYLGKLSSTLQSITDVIYADGIVQTPRLGSFCSDEMRIYLYLENIIQAANGKKREYVLITTFIHEMFHAWNYIACGKKDRTIREIDEAMVEFATLCFLKQISQVHSEFEPIFEWAKRDISRKQTAIGSIAGYGYGYYLYSLANKNESPVIELLVAYIRKSGFIAPSALVDLIKAKLYPTYPYNEEKQVYKMLQQLLLHNCMVRGQVWSRSGKTNIVTRDKSLLFEENVDSISRLEIDNVSSDLYLIKDGGLFKIYGENRGKWFPVFNELFDDVKSIKYGKYYIVFVKRHHDGKEFLLSPLNLLKIRDIHNTIILEDCMSADNFSYYEKEEGLYLYSETNRQYSYILPYYSRLRTRVVEVDDPQNVYYFIKCGHQYVRIDTNNRVLIYSIEGHKIGVFDGVFDFGDYTDGTEKHEYMNVEKDGKFNLYSFENMCLHYDEWLEDCDCPEFINGEWLFKVKNHGICKILNAAGNDISDKHRDVLEQWIEDSKDRMESQK